MEDAVYENESMHNICITIGFEETKSDLCHYVYPRADKLSFVEVAALPFRSIKGSTPMIM